MGLRGKNKMCFLGYHNWRNFTVFDQQYRKCRECDKMQDFNGFVCSEFGRKKDWQNVPKDVMFDFKEFGMWSLETLKAQSDYNSCTVPSTNNMPEQVERKFKKLNKQYEKNKNKKLGTMTYLEFEQLKTEIADFEEDVLIPYNEMKKLVPFLYIYY